MDLASDKLARFRSAWRRRERNRRRKCEILRQKAYQEAGLLTTILVAHQGVYKVVLFGSTLDQERFCETSDIDLAVWGLEPQAYYQVRAELENMSSFPVDLVPMEDARPGIKKQIDHGEILYER